MAGFMMVLAVITWIGGIISAIAVAADYESFLMFLMIAAGAVIEGSLFAAVSMMLNSLERIETKTAKIESDLKALAQKQETENTPAPAKRVETAPKNAAAASGPAETPAEVKKAEDIPSDCTVCPKCGTMQKKNRSVCYQCGESLLAENLPYICGNCGHPGPYDNACPACGSTMKAMNIKA